MKANRRPGNLGNTQYPVHTSMAKRRLGMVDQKLAEIEMAKVANGTPLTAGQRTQRILEHLKNPRRLSQNT